MAKYVRKEKTPPETIGERVARTAAEWSQAIVLAIGFAMTGYVNFYLGIVILTIGVTLVCVNVWFKTKTRSTYSRIAILFLIAGAYVGSLWFFMFVAAPLDVLMTTVDANYEAASTVLGLTWKSEYWPVNIRIDNDTDYIYSGYDAYIRTNLGIAKIVLRPSINNCVATFEDPHLQTFSAYSKIFKNGTYITVPMFEQGDPVVSTFYRIRCDKLAAKSSVQILLAVVGGQPTWAAMSSHYDAVERNRVSFNRQCFKEPCADIPTTSGDLEK
jgi:hypothetical protein